MTTSTYATEQLKAQWTSLMTTIKMKENELSEEAIDKMYAKATELNNVIENNKPLRATTDAMFS